MVTDTLDLTHVRVGLGVLLDMTEEQRSRLRILVEGFHPESVVLVRDMWMEGAILFTLYNSEQESILHGLIESNGDCNT